MPRELICPKCGAFLPLDEPEADASNNFQDPDPAHTIETVIPATLSVHDHPVDLPATNQVIADDLVDNAPLDEEPSRHEPSRNGSSEVDHPAAALFSPEASPVAVLTEPTFPSLEPAPSTPVPHEAPAPVEEAEATGPGMGFVLLASYASAMTLACLWLVWQARHRDATGPDTLPVDSRPDDRSGTLSVIPKDRTTTLGRPLRVGDLELTPLRATLGQVTLESASSGGKRQTKPGGEGSVLLTISLKNTSAMSAFAPLEKAFLRTPDTGAPASFIEGESGPIDLYPLAMSSEWRIVGQDLRELKPGESMQTLIAGEPTAARNLAGTLRLRLKLRSTPGDTSVVHIEIDGDSLQ